MILHWVWLLPAIMATSFVLILFFGKRMPKKGSEIGIAAVGLCLILAFVSAGSWTHHVNEAHGAPVEVVEPGQIGSEVAAGETAVKPIETNVDWFDVGPLHVEVGTLVDGLSVMMLVV